MAKRADLLRGATYSKQEKAALVKVYIQQHPGAKEESAKRQVRRMTTEGPQRRTPTKSFVKAAGRALEGLHNPEKATYKAPENFASRKGKIDKLWNGKSFTSEKDAKEYAKAVRAGDKESYAAKRITSVKVTYVGPGKTVPYYKATQPGKGWHRRPVDPNGEWIVTVTGYVNYRPSLDVDAEDEENEEVEE